jgi:DNA-directed RNA polymerase alpha subunit
MQKQVEELNTTTVKEAPIKVSDLNLSTRLTNALMKSNYDNLRKLEGLTEEEVASIRGMGSKSYIELLEVLKKYNIKLV